MSGRIVAVAGLFALVLVAATKPVTVQMKDAMGKDVGTAVISEKKGGGVQIKTNFRNLPPGDHAIHIHAVGKCEAPAFTTAGGHFNPSGKKHGLQNPDGPHNGDMVNFKVTPKGTAKETIVDANVSMGDGANSIFANGGTALMIHGMADDMKSDPAGNAGPRIACGVISK